MNRQRIGNVHVHTRDIYKSQNDIHIYTWTNDGMIRVSINTTKGRARIQLANVASRCNRNYKCVYTYVLLYVPWPQLARTVSATERKGIYYCGCEEETEVRRRFRN